jgi:hypothetical protein
MQEDIQNTRKSKFSKEVKLRESLGVANSRKAHSWLTGCPIGQCNVVVRLLPSCMEAFNQPEALDRQDRTTDLSCGRSVSAAVSYYHTVK